MDAEEAEIGISLDNRRNFHLTVLFVACNNPAYNV